PRPRRGRRGRAPARTLLPELRSRRALDEQRPVVHVTPPRHLVLTNLPRPWPPGQPHRVYFYRTRILTIELRRGTIGAQAEIWRNADATAICPPRPDPEGQEVQRTARLRRQALPPPAHRHPDRRLLPRRRLRRDLSHRRRRPRLGPRLLARRHLRLHRRRHRVRVRRPHRVR